MKNLVLIGFVAAFMVAFSASTNSSALGNDQKRRVPTFPPVNEIVAMFNSAVARGELIVFERKLNSNMVRPVRVEYVVDLGSSKPKIKVYAELTPPLEPPEMPDCKAFAISVGISVDGHVAETDIHVRPE